MNQIPHTVTLFKHALLKFGEWSVLKEDRVAGTNYLA